MRCRAFARRGYSLVIHLGCKRDGQGFWTASVATTVRRAKSQPTLAQDNDRRWLLLWYPPETYVADDLCSPVVSVHVSELLGSKFLHCLERFSIFISRGFAVDSSLLCIGLDWNGSNGQTIKQKKKAQHPRSPIRPHKNN